MLGYCEIPFDCFQTVLEPDFQLKVFNSDMVLIYRGRQESNKHILLYLKNNHYDLIVAVSAISKL